MTDYILVRQHWTCLDVAPTARPNSGITWTILGASEHNALVFETGYPDSALPVRALSVVRHAQDIQGQTWLDADGQRKTAEINLAAKVDAGERQCTAATVCKTVGLEALGQPDLPRTKGC